jgi:hypothetical protein
VPAGVAMIVVVEIPAVVADVETRTMECSAAVEILTAVLAHVEARTLETSAAAEIPTVNVDLENMEAPAAGEMLTAIELDLDNTMEAPAAVDEARIQYQRETRARAAPPLLLHLAPQARSQADRLQLVLPFLSKAPFFNRAPSKHHRKTTPVPLPKGPKWMAMHKKDPRQSV